MSEPWPDAVQRRGLLRPRPAGMGGALLAMVVAVVIFIGLVIWYAVNPGEIEPERLSDLESVHQLAAECHQRHPQLARQAADYLDEALPRLERARFEAGFDGHDALEELFCRAVAVEPDNPQAVAGWIEVHALRALRQEGADIEALDRAWVLLLGLHRLEPDTPGLAIVGSELHRARRGLSE